MDCETTAVTINQAIPILNFRVALAREHSMLTGGLALTFEAGIDTPGTAARSSC